MINFCLLATLVRFQLTRNLSQILTPTPIPPLQRRHHLCMVPDDVCASSVTHSADNWEMKLLSPLPSSDDSSPFPHNAWKVSRGSAVGCCRPPLASICSGLLQALKFGLLHPMPQVNEDKQLPAEENTVQNVSRICRHKYGNSACLRAIFRRTTDATSLPESFKSNNSPPLSNNTRRRMELPRVYE